MYQSLYKQILNQILIGHLAPGTRLPSSRSLSAEIGCSRGTVERAYEMLLMEDFIQGAGAAGTRVNPNLDSRLIASRVRDAHKDRPKNKSNYPRESKVLPLQLGVPSLDAFPRQRWNRLMSKHIRHSGIDQLARGSSFGYFPLRQALANYLAISRGINTEPEQIFITAGFQGGLSMIIQCMGQVGDKIWCEDPGYFRARDCLKQLGVAMVPVPVDDDGMRVADGIKQANNAKFALVTPTHQAPLGVTLSLVRRLELLHWANTQGSWVIEDDYDSEFRYGEKPPPALKSLDANERVIYTGSFSKVLIPSLKLGYIVVPQSLQSRFETCFSALGSVGALVEQKAITELMVKGQFSLHIKKMRKLYGERREALATALEHTLANELNIKLQTGGMHLIGELLNIKDESLLQKNAQQLGLGLHFLSSYQIKSKHPPSLLLNFTNVDVTSAKNVVDRLAEAIAKSCRG